MKEQYMLLTKKRMIVIGILLVVLLLAGGYLFLTTRYHVTKVKVSGNEHYTDEEIKKMILPGGIRNNSLLLSLQYRKKEIKNIPFIESMEVEVVAHNSIKITVYEKALAGCVKYLGSYMYFDREGIVVESSDSPSEGIPQVTGLSFGYMKLYEKLPVENDDIFREILVITQLLEKYNIKTDKIHFDKSMQMTLYFGEAKVFLGSDDNIDEKIMQLQYILPDLEGKSGTLHMEEYQEGTKRVTFELD